MAATSDGLLSGLRVLSVEQYGAGPFGTQVLADLGAEVIKIENPRDGGDVSRSLGPFFGVDLPESASSLFFAAINRNKRSLALDLANPEGKAVFHRLVADADAVACNLRGDVPGRLGLTYETLGEIKPAIVCAHLTAYGREGSRANWPGYDYLIQAEAGYFGINGDPEGPPARFGLSIVDFMTGYAIGLALVSAVLKARTSGVGRDVDVSLYDVGIANLNYLGVWAMNTGYEPGRLPRSAHPSLTPCQLYRTADGWIYIMANKEKFWRVLCERLGRAELADDPRFRTFTERAANRDALTVLLDEAFGQAGTAEWMQRLAGGVPAAPVNSVAQAIDSDFFRESGMGVTMGDGAWSAVRGLGNPIRSGAALPSAPPPALGQDTDHLLAEAGFEAEAIARLRKSGVVG
ncbi:MAG: CoA transferase [Azospirillaceae bacterium]